MMKSVSPVPTGPAALRQDLPATSGERRASGKAARKRVRRSTLGSWAEADRGHDALETPPRAAGALARAHARTGDPVEIDSYIGKGPKFTAEIGRFASLYADQNEKDHAQLVEAIAAGTVQSLPV